MKKIINNILTATYAMLLIGCGNNQEQEVRIDPAQVIAQAKEVIGIGKILPGDGIITLAAPNAGIIEKVLVRAGDSVSKGDLIIQIRSQQEQLTASESRAQLATQLAKNKAEAYEVQLAETKLAELYKKYLTSKELAEKGAETAEVLDTDYSAYMQQQQKVTQARQQANANQKIIEELQQRVKLSELSVSDKQIRAPENGVILNLDVTIGQTLEANTAFGELAPSGELVVECEVDELYAHTVQEGQKVLIYPTSNASPVAEGTITYVGASLQDKSILYEKVGEGADRRVRRVTVAISKTDKPLLINDKVECKILLP